MRINIRFIYPHRISLAETTNFNIFFFFFLEIIVKLFKINIAYSSNRARKQ